VDLCAKTALWGWAQANNVRFLYAYLQNNRNGVDEVAAYCTTNESVAFGGLSADAIAPFFGYNFGNLTIGADSSASR
jgi:hypothetical protein